MSSTIAHVESPPREGGSSVGSDTPKPASSVEDHFGAYLREISRIPLLDPETERRVAREARNGDSEAQRLLVESNLRFVVSMARRYARSGYPIEELVNEGNLGLMEAVRRFDPDRGVRFVSYAGWWVRQAILAAIAHYGQAFSIPPKLKFERYQFEKRVRELAQDLHRNPTVAEIASALETDEASVRALLEAIPGEVSLSETLGSDGFRIEDTIADPRENGMDDRLMAQSFRRSLDLSLEQLSGRERYVVERRFGLRGPGFPNKKARNRRGHGSEDDDVPATLAELGAELDISRERVRQIEVRALDKLRRSEMAHQLRHFVGVQLN